MRTIDATEVMARLAGGDETLLVDVVPEDRFHPEHIPGAISVPLSRPGFPAWVRELTSGSTSKPVAVYCGDGDGDLSRRAAQQLEEAGFSDVATFEGGVEAWKQAGFPTART